MRTLFLSLGLLVAVPAFAEDGPNIVIPDITEVDFEAVDVNATLQRPSMVVVQERAGARFTPLVRLRGHFGPEMRASLSTL